MEIDLAAVFRVRREVRHRLVGDEAVIVQQAAGQVLAVSEVGARILAALDGVTPVSGILELLLEEYDVDPERLAADLWVFLTQLEEQQVAERAQP